MKLLLPETISQNDRCGHRVSSANVGISEITPQQRFEPQQSEVIFRDEHARQRLTSFRESKKIERPAVQSDSFEALGGFSPRRELSNRARAVVGLASDSLRRNKNETIRSFVGRWGE